MPVSKTNGPGWLGIGWNGATAATVPGSFRYAPAARPVFLLVDPQLSGAGPTGATPSIGSACGRNGLAETVNTAVLSRIGTFGAILGSGGADPPATRLDIEPKQSGIRKLDIRIRRKPAALETRIAPMSMPMLILAPTVA
jgi:hypothetical protein